MRKKVSNDFQSVSHWEFSILDVVLDYVSLGSSLNTQIFKNKENTTLIFVVDVSYTKNLSCQYIQIFAKKKHIKLKTSQVELPSEKNSVCKCWFFMMNVQPNAYFLK